MRSVVFFVRMPVIWLVVFFCVAYNLRHPLIFHSRLTPTVDTDKVGYLGSCFAFERGAGPRISSSPTLQTLHITSITEFYLWILLQRGTKFLQWGVFRFVSDNFVQFASSQLFCVNLPCWFLKIGVLPSLTQMRFSPSFLLRQTYPRCSFLGHRSTIHPSLQSIFAISFFHSMSLFNVPSRPSLCPFILLTVSSPVPLHHSLLSIRSVSVLQPVQYYTRSISCGCFWRNAFAIEWNTS